MQHSINEDLPLIFSHRIPVFTTLDSGSAHASSALLRKLN